MNSPNKLTIKKTKDKLLFYINDTEVFSTDYKPYPGSYHGFYINKKKSVSFENIIVKQNISTKINLIKNLKTGLKKENLGANVNSVFDDKMPVISPDGKILFVCRDGEDVNKDDIWTSEQINDSTLGAAKNIGFPLNNTGPNFVISITPDNNTLLLGNTYNKDGSSYSAGYSMANKTESGWSIPKEVKMKNYKNKHAFTSSSLANNREIMVLSAQLEKTYGKSDLYVSFLLADSTWAEPKNLGPIINTF